jgi:DNA-binding NtrC family response regulator
MENRIMLVDDEAGVIKALRRLLMDEPYEVLTAQSAEEALTMLEKSPCKVVISDEMMPGMKGSEFLCHVKEIYPDTIRIILTGHASLDSAMKAVNSGEIYRFFMKPWNNMEIILAIRSAMEKYDLLEENARLLALVRKQADDLKAMEQRYPGISLIERDADGSVILPDVTDEEAQQLLKELSEGDETSKNGQ